MAMELAARPWITAGIALVGAGVVVVTPVKAAVPDIEVAAVQLTSSPEGIDPITAIEDVSKLARTNSVALDEHFSPVPLPTPQQVIADLLDGKQIDLQAAGNAAVGTTPEINILPLLSLLPAGTLPPSVDITSLDLVLGGLLSPGSSLLNGISATVSGLPVSLTGNAVEPIGSSTELDQAIATALGFSFPTPAGDTVSPLGDLVSILTTALDGDLSTALTCLSTDFSALLTDSLGNLTSLF
jgi:hypothetical protein